MKKQLLLLLPIIALISATTHLTANYIEVANKGSKPIEVQIDGRGNLGGNAKINKDVFPEKTDYWYLDQIADLTIKTDTEVARRKILSDGYRHYIDVYPNHLIIRHYNASNILISTDDPIYFGPK